MWIAHVFAAMLLAWYGAVSWQRGRDADRQAVIAAALMFCTVLLGAGWVVHPAAAIGIGAAFACAGVRNDALQALRIFGLTTAFAFTGAVWAGVPLVVAGVLAVRKSSEDEFVLGEHKATAVNPWPPQHTAGPPRQLHGRQPPSWATQSWQQPGRTPHPPLGRPNPVPTPRPLPPNRSELVDLADHPRLPADLAKRVRELDARCEGTLGYLAERGPAADQLRFEVEQIRDDYAPDAVRAYLALPPSTADSQPLRDGRTGRDIFTEQLLLLTSGLSDIEARAGQSGAGKLLAHELFLQEKFGRNQRDLEL